MTKLFFVDLAAGEALVENLDRAHLGIHATVVDTHAPTFWAASPATSVLRGSFVVIIARRRILNEVVAQPPALNTPSRQSGHRNWNGIYRGALEHEWSPDLAVETS